MSQPKRIQRKRTRGWKMPEGAVYVGRPTKWGNPFVVGKHSPTAELAVMRFRNAIENGAWPAWRKRIGQCVLETITVEHVQRVLRGKDLACWCLLCAAHRDGKPLGEACGDCSQCHADVLLEIANREDRDDG